MELPSTDRDLPPEAARQIDRKCDEFEAALRRGEAPRLEDFLAGLAGAARLSLLRELVPLDADYRRAKGTAPSPEDYLARFPELGPAWLAAVLGASGSFATPGAPPGPATEPPASPRLAGFELLGELGRGSMGVVYRALDCRTGRVVALKTMQRRDGASLELFKREFRYLQGVSHPNLAQLYELASDGRDWLLTMELVEGTDFLSHVRPDPGGAPDPARLRETLGQLADGVAALHAHRRVHRDLKPQNVRVTPEGRVVILDFGLAAGLSPAGEHVHTDQLLMGTLAYMAPEQGHSPPVSSPASDWYSVGVMLYQALAGRLPFTGGYFVMMQDKQNFDPPAPSRLGPGVPEDLDELCLALLCRPPRDRPHGAEVLRRLARGPLPPPGVPAEEAPLLGREPHLRLLEEAYAASRQRHAVLVASYGPSGVGKSALVRRFLGGLAGRGAVVLAGRCYERESVPYKALDPVVDELARYLGELPAQEAEARLPRDVGPLTRVFPVLGRVAAVAQAPRSAALPDPYEERRRAFAGLRELLARIGDRRPLVLHIDDLQWGDVDSARLLVDLLLPPDPPALLLVISYRSEDAASPCLGALAKALGRGQEVDRRELPVAPLGEAETCALAYLLLGASAGDWAARVACESGGNPFFVTELVREAQSRSALAGGDQAGGEVTLDGLIRARAARLPEGARRLLEVVAVSGRPLAEQQAWAASGAGDEAPNLAARLQAERLVRAAGSARGDRLETYHDRVREAVVAGLDPARRIDCHRRLAAALEAAGDSDPESLAAHWEAGQEPERAGRYYARAAARAAQALAFDRAATLYRSALDLLPAREASEGRLMARLGDALADAGRGAESARAYLAAAAGERAEALELQRRAAQQFLISGHVDEGLRALRAVLAAVGLRLAPTPRLALLSLLFRRARLWLRGLGFRERDASQVPKEELERIDICWSVTEGLTMIDTIRAADFQSLNLLLSLRAGEPFRATRALLAEAGHTSVAGSKSPRRTARLLRAAEAAAARTTRPEALGFLWSLRGITAYLEGRWRGGREGCERAEAVFRGRCTGVTWWLDSTHQFLLSSVAELGEFGELRRRLPPLLQEAKARGNLYALVSLVAFITPLVRLADDDPDGARREMDEVMGQWSQQGFHVQHANAMHRRGEIDLYQGRGEAARGRADELWSALAGSLLLRVQEKRVNATFLRARAALSAATAAADPKPLLLAAERDARRLDGERRPDCTARARVIRSAVAARRGDAGVAAALLREAAVGFDAADMRLSAAASRRRLGGLLGGEEGEALIARADAWMAGQQIRDPARMTAMLAPGFPEGQASAP